MYRRYVALVYLIKCQLKESVLRSSILTVIEGGNFMITGVGTDIIEISRIRQAIDRRETFVERVFTTAEIEICRPGGNFAQRFAGRFAAKEAVAKALGTSLSWLDVEILSEPSGKPVVRLLGQAAEVANGRSVLVSISHCHEYAVAHAVAVLD